MWGINLPYALWLDEIDKVVTGTSFHHENMPGNRYSAIQRADMSAAQVLNMVDSVITFVS